MEQYNVTGMSCAACSARVEKAVSKVPGVTSCSVSLLTNSMGVEGTAISAEIIKAVQDAGYGASPKRADAAAARAPRADLAAPADPAAPKPKRRCIASLGFLLVLMYFSMGHMMWGWPLPPFYDNNHVAMGLTQLLLTGIIMVINQKFFISGYKALWHRAPNMDTLVALGAAAAFGYSTYALFAMTGAQVAGGCAPRSGRSGRRVGRRYQVWRPIGPSGGVGRSRGARCACSAGATLCSAGRYSTTLTTPSTRAMAGSGVIRLRRAAWMSSTRSTAPTSPWTFCHPAARACSKRRSAFAARPTCRKTMIFWPTCWRLTPTAPSGAALRGAWRWPPKAWTMPPSTPSMLGASGCCASTPLTAAACLTKS